MLGPHAAPENFRNETKPDRHTSNHNIQLNQHAQVALSACPTFRSTAIVFALAPGAAHGKDTGVICLARKLMQRPSPTEYTYTPCAVCTILYMYMARLRSTDRGGTAANDQSLCIPLTLSVVCSSSALLPGTVPRKYFCICQSN